MTVRITELCAQRLAAGTTFAAQFNGGTIQVYEGPLPIAAELAPGGTLLGTVKNQVNADPQYVLDGSTFTLDPSDVWRVVLTATGTPGFLRFTPNVSNPGSVLVTDQHNLPLVTTIAQAVELNSFYVTFST